MRSKSEVNLLFQKFYNTVHTMYKARIQVLHSDNVVEYYSSKL